MEIDIQNSFTDRFLRNFVHTYYKDSPPHLKFVSTLPCETWKLQLLLILMAYCMWDLRIHLARDEAALLAQTWILWLWNLENNAAVLRRGSVMSANWSSGWLTCNMGCIRQSLMKLTPVNGVNVCELVFVSEMDVFITCFNCRTIDDQV